MIEIGSNTFIWINLYQGILDQVSVSIQRAHRPSTAQKVLPTSPYHMNPTTLTFQHPIRKLSSYLSLFKLIMLYTLAGWIFYEKWHEWSEIFWPTVPKLNGESKKMLRKEKMGGSCQKLQKLTKFWNFWPKCKFLAPYRSKKIRHHQLHFETILIHISFSND